jgi:uncharacterized membrane protein YeaQ/YmgE (transglycosylase-associated protein family)
MTNFIAWVIFGLVVGAIAKMIMPGKDPGGWIVTILLGISGSLIGGYVAQILDLDAVGTNEFSFINMLAAIGGAIVLLGVFRLFNKNKMT